MNENAKAWVAALRSGEWHQSRDALRTEGEGRTGFCCLGVACEMSGLGAWIDGAYFQDRDQHAETERRQRNESQCPHCEGYDDECRHKEYSEEFTSPMVQKWLGLSSEDGTFTLDGAHTSLVRLNDDGKSFAEIADIIEKHQDQLFEGEASNAP